MSVLSPPGTAKRYNRAKLALGIAGSGASLALPGSLVLTGAARDISAFAAGAAGNAYLALLLFLLIVGSLQTAALLPIGFASGYVVEHRYGLSAQTPAGWAWERLKALLVALPLGTVVAVALYFCLQRFGARWWLPVAALVTLLSVVLTRLAPALILPLFYSLRPLAGGPLRERLVALCASAGMTVEGIFTFDMSKNTRKANAAFTGIGRAKRVLLGDTLLHTFTEDEIETICAHEIGHYRHRHILAGMLTGAASTFAGLFFGSLLHAWSLPLAGAVTLTDLAALPLLALWLSLLGILAAPFGNMLSRHHERQADTFAVAATGKKEAFLSALRKLAATNLADPEPHPLVEFLFFSHPAMGRRIRRVEGL